MTNNEVNKVIAEYIGLGVCKCCDDGWDGISRSVHTKCRKCGNEHMYNKFKFTESLDALIPVWNRLGRYAACGKQEEQGFQATMLPTTVSNMASVYSMPTIQEAAAHATAKAILELNND